MPCPTCQPLQQENTALQQENTALRAQVRALEAQVEHLQALLDAQGPSPGPHSPPASLPPFLKPSPPKGRRHKPGRKKGHPGTSRARPPQIDETVEVTLACCPTCGGPLSQDDEVELRSHVQEDLRPARVWVTCFRRHRYYCRACRQVVEAPPQGEEIPHSRFGPRLLLGAALLKHAWGLPYEKVRGLLSWIWGLKVSAGGLAQASDRLQGRLTPEVGALLEAIRASPAVQVDETGWRVNGVNFWLWVFTGGPLTLYRIDRRRSRKVPQEVLGEDFEGVVGCDFYTAYDPLSYAQQKCWGHLLREGHHCAQKNPSEEYARFWKRLKRLWRDAKRLGQQQGELPPEVFTRRLERLQSRLKALGQAPWQDADALRLARRLSKQEGRLLTFLEREGVEATNNGAERALRPQVVMRKVCGGSRSPKGAEVHAALASLMRSCQQQGRDFVSYGIEALRHHREGQPGAVLLPRSSPPVSES